MRKVYPQTVLRVLLTEAFMSRILVVEDDKSIREELVKLAVSVIIVHNRFNNRKKELCLFRQIGMEKGKMLRICMIEVLRESLWCIITAPLVLIAQFISYKLKIAKL